MLIILDDVLDAVDLELTQRHFGIESNRTTNWIPSDYQGICTFGSPMAKLLMVADKYVAIKESMVGCEYWAHFGTRPEWHIDKDEQLCKRTGQFVTPICSIVFYAQIDGLVGGDFCTQLETITPKTNRMIIFSPNILHTVQPYDGTRLSVAINPWAVTPESYQ